MAPVAEEGFRLQVAPDPDPTVPTPPTESEHPVPWVADDDDLPGNFTTEAAPLLFATAPFSPPIPATCLPSGPGNPSARSEEKDEGTNTDGAVGSGAAVVFKITLGSESI